MQSKRKHWAAKTTLVLTLGAFVSLSAATAVSAAPGDTVVDPSKKGTVTIHKFENPDSALAELATGKPLDLTGHGLTPLPGVTFSLERINPATYDLTTNEGWTSAAKVSAADAALESKDPAVTITTDSLGEATAIELPLGLYLVTETAVPAGVTAGAPFLVTIPLTDPDTQNSWIYDIHLYPKNAKIGTGEKTVSDKNATKIGDDITFTIRGDIPNLPVIDGYRITDPLDPRLTYKSATVTLEGGATLVPSDYELVVTPPAGGNGAIVTLTFTASGLAKLAQDSSAKVQLVIDTTVSSLGSGEINNTALIFPNEASFDKQPGEPGGPVEPPTVTSKFGNIDIFKTNARTDEALSGAKFAVYLSEADAIEGDPAKRISIGGTSVWTSSATGTIKIEGLRASGWVNGVAVLPGHPDFQYYWIDEVEAPVGFELISKPIRVEVKDIDAAVDVTVENAEENGGFTLPFTGSVLSASLFYGAGALVLAGAVVMVVRARRKTELADQAATPTV